MVDATDNGQAEQIIELLRSLPPEQQGALLAEPEAVRRLAYNGQAEQVIEIIQRLSPEQQRAVLAVPGAKEGLADNGQKEATEEININAERSLARVRRHNTSSGLQR